MLSKVTKASQPMLRIEEDALLVWRRFREFSQLSVSNPERQQIIRNKTTRLPTIPVYRAVWIGRHCFMLTCIREQRFSTAALRLPQAGSVHDNM